MKFKRVRAALTLLLAILAFNIEATATYSKTFRGQVIEVNQDEEGSSIVLQTANGTLSVYAPRSRANEIIVERAIKAREMKTSFSISTENL
ncbi:MAG: hypothetical protein NDI63_08840 [Pseudobdellovibrio sp.]|nr:hypothetical protein [Pseudobdellovibrio sp.]